MTRTRILLACAVPGTAAIAVFGSHGWPELVAAAAVLAGVTAVAVRMARAERRDARQALWSTFEREFWTYVERRGQTWPRRSPGA